MLSFTSESHSITSRFSYPSGMVGDAFDMEKPIVFKHEEILSSTDNFSDTNLLGHGKYGSVYYGVLRDQVCKVLVFAVEKSLISGS